MDPQHKKVLENLEAGRPFEHGFVHHQNAVRAMFTCLTNGWVGRNQLTRAGRDALEQTRPIKGNYEITIVKDK